MGDAWSCYFLILNLIYCILIRLNLVLWKYKKWIDEFGKLESNK